MQNVLVKTEAEKESYEPEQYDDWAQALLTTGVGAGPWIPLETIRAREN
jgi:hypothetical protein